MNEVISVIVPIYNSQKRLERCIESILNSQYSALEIILVDDGSTDKSGTICDKIQKKDSRVKVFHIENGGVSKARNFGLKKASGQFIAFIDSDDYVGTEYFYELKNNLIDNESQLAVGTIVHIWNGDFKKDKVFSKEGKVDFRKISKENQELFLEWNKKFLLYGPCNKLYYKEIIWKNNIYFPENMVYGEDLIFNLQYIEHIESISYKRKPEYFYDHGNEDSLTHKYRKNRFENGIKINHSLKNFFIKKNYWGIEEKKFIYLRIFDDAYNSIFELWNPACKMLLKSKVRRIKEILNNKDVIQSMEYINKDMYPSIYVWMLKKRKILLFIFLREVRKNGRR